MKATLGWLKSHLDTKAGPAELAEALTQLGLEVESISDPAKVYAPFIIAKVLTCEKHPNADKLTVCTVDAGKGAVQVVCGALNARAGMKGVFAPAGSHIPGTGLDLKVTDIRGVKSNGMLCSAFELMLSDDHEGIIELANDAPVGKSYAAYAGLDDPVLDIAVTPNRPDCLGIAGIARDLAAKGVGKLKTPLIKPVKGTFASPVGLALDFPASLSPKPCSLFVGRFIRGVKNGTSPAWLQARLRAIGLRPISALVDITNFITHDRSRPLHVYDAAKLRGNVSARLAKKGESLKALDGKTYRLDGSECVIADEANALGLGGVMGGEATGCTENTTDVFVESALFDPVRTAETGRKHGIESDARFRFERGVDPAFTAPGMELATRMILDLCGGTPSRLVAAGKANEAKREITFRPERMKALAGVAVPIAIAKGFLEKLGFTVAGGKTLKVKVPSWRGDVSGEADLVEEVLRLKGYDAIPMVSMPRWDAVPKPVLSPAQKRAGAVRRALAAAGLSECVTYSFVAPAVAKLFGGGAEALTLENPISVELSVMRPCIVPNLILAAQRNFDRGGRAIALYEVGPQYADDTPAGEALVAAGVRLGPTAPRHWKRKSAEAGVIEAKADAYQALAAAGVDPAKAQVTREAPAWYHPFRSGTLKLGPHITLGHFGEVHPRTLKALDARSPLAAFEIFLDAVPLPRPKPTRTKSALKLSQLPQVERDFAFVVDAAVPAAVVVEAARKAAREAVRDVEVFDLFEGKGLPAGKKSIAIAVRLEPKDKTFTDAEIERFSKAIVAAVEAATSGKLRS
jgi:phenylalanyl-tRNA synthetase beta chain